MFKIIMSITSKYHSFLFSEIGPFHNCNKTLKDQIISHSRIKQLKKDQLIHQANDPADEIFCVLDGQVRISYCDANGSYVLVQDLGPGAWFGFMGYYGIGTRPQDACAHISSEISYIKGAVLDRLLQNSPETYRAILKQMAGYSTHFFNSFYNAVNVSLKKRVIEMLVQIGKWQKTSEINITQNELASFLGATREAVGIHLNELQRTGAIELKYKKIKLTRNFLLLNSNK